MKQVLSYGIQKKINKIYGADNAYGGVYPDKNNVAFIGDSILFGTLKGYLIVLNRSGELMEVMHASRIINPASFFEDTSKSLHILGLQGADIVLKYGDCIFNYNIRGITQ